MSRYEAGVPLPLERLLEPGAAGQAPIGVIRRGDRFDQVVAADGPQKGTDAGVGGTGLRFQHRTPEISLHGPSFHESRPSFDSSTFFT
jgi:hypothetical protein